MPKVCLSKNKKKRLKTKNRPPLFSPPPPKAQISRSPTNPVSSKKIKRRLRSHPGPVARACPRIGRLSRGFPAAGGGGARTRNRLYRRSADITRRSAAATPQSRCARPPVRSGADPLHIARSRALPPASRTPGIQAAWIGPARSASRTLTL